MLRLAAGRPPPVKRRQRTGQRYRALLATLLGCGLRRRELADLDFGHLQRRDEHWVIVDLIGKGGHIRTGAIVSHSRRRTRTDSVLDRSRLGTNYREVRWMQTAVSGRSERPYRNRTRSLNSATWIIDQYSPGEVIHTDFPSLAGSAVMR